MQQIYTVQIRSLAYVDVLLNPENGNTTMMNSHTVGKSVGVSGLICLSVCHSLSVYLDFNIR